MSKESKGLAPPAAQDRVTDERSREGASPPSGSVPTGAGAFTPGPWEILGDDAGADGYPYLEVSAGECGTKGFKSIAHVQCEPVFGASIYDDSGELTETDHANARLIAAAPELYEQVTLFARCIEYQIRVAEQKGDDEGARLQSLTLAIVNGVLARVSGEAQ